jgi:hypothetical protein
MLDSQNMSFFYTHRFVPLLSSVGAIWLQFSLGVPSWLRSLAVMRRLSSALDQKKGSSRDELFGFVLVRLS